MKRFKFLSGVALVTAFLVVPGIAADKAKEADKSKAHKLSEWRLGEVLFGDKLSESDLKGKVVVIENWGVHCGPCIASLPHLAELDKKLRDKGLRIIGAESQGSSKDDIKPLLDNAKVKYTITAGDSGPIQVSGIPRAFIFDTQGILVFDGHPADPTFEKTIKEEVRKVKAEGGKDAPVVASGPLIPTRAWTNSDGHEIRAAVKTADASKVTFLLPNNKEVAYPLDKLSDESRAAIAAAMQPKE